MEQQIYDLYQTIKPKMMPYMGGYASGGALMGGARASYMPMAMGSRMIKKGGKGRPFTRKNVFGVMRTKNLFGPKGHGRVHYASRANIQPSARQAQHRAFIKDFIERQGKPGTRAGAQANMRAANAEWRAQMGTVVTQRAVVR
jgi:hypothetical protein